MANESQAHDEISHAGRPHLAARTDPRRAAAESGLGATVVIVECDAQVQRSYDYRGKPPKAVKGGGGTEFEPVFKWMREQRPFDGVPYLTDACGPATSSRPNCNLLWVISEGGSTEVLPIGPTVRIRVAKE